MIRLHHSIFPAIGLFLFSNVGLAVEKFDCREVPKKLDSPNKEVRTQILKGVDDECLTSLMHRAEFETKMMERLSDPEGTLTKELGRRNKAQLWSGFARLYIANPGSAHEGFSHEMVKLFLKFPRMVLEEIQAAPASANAEHHVGSALGQSKRSIAALERLADDPKWGPLVKRLKSFATPQP